MYVLHLCRSMCMWVCMHVHTRVCIYVYVCRPRIDVGLPWLVSSWTRHSLIWLVSLAIFLWEILFLALLCWDSRWDSCPFGFYMVLGVQTLVVLIMWQALYPWSCLFFLIIIMDMISEDKELCLSPDFQGMISEDKWDVLSGWSVHLLGWC